MEHIDFSSYLEKVVTDDSKDKINTFFSKYPHIKEELFHHTKNSIMSTIYRKDQSRDYINWVIDTLKFIERFF